MNTKLSKIIWLCLCPGLLLISQNAFSWGQKGHDVVCAVAEQHLSGSARKKIEKVLDGKSIVYWANWMDNASHTKEYSYTSTWHYKNVDAGETYETAPINKDGDVVIAIDNQIQAIKGGNLSKEEEALALKMLVHFVGDLHCPMHMGHKSDLGGNKWQVRYFNSGTNLHSIWDSGVVESAHNWTYTEWVEQIDRVSGKDAALIASGVVADWAKETLAISDAVYDGTPVGSKLSYDYVYEWAPTIEGQLLKAGLRLARILNELY